MRIWCHKEGICKYIEQGYEFDPKKWKETNFWVHRGNFETLLVALMICKVIRRSDIFVFSISDGEFVSYCFEPKVNKRSWKSRTYCSNRVTSHELERINVIIISYDVMNNIGSRLDRYEFVAILL